jgi:hypothetical protein
MKLALILSIILVALLGSETASLCADTWEGPCANEYSRWSTSVSTLRESMDSLRQVKQQSLRSDILDAVSRAGSGVTTARIVQSLLDKRNRLVAQGTETCRRLADEERFAFDDLKRCAASGSQRRGYTAQAIAPFAREREKVMAELRDVLLDEAYVQYKGERDVAPASAGSDPWPQSRVSFEGQAPWNQHMNYGRPNAFTPRYQYGN